MIKNKSINTFLVVTLFFSALADLRAAEKRHPAFKSDFQESREHKEKKPCCDDKHDHKLKDAIGTQACQRKAIIGSRKYIVDILSTKKGEGLRYTMQKDPLALELLEQYQTDSKKVKYAAYVGTPALLLTGWRIAQEDNVGKDTLFWVGVTGLVGSYIWGRIMSSSNENTLDEAVSMYNFGARKNNSPEIIIEGE